MKLRLCPFCGRPAIPFDGDFYITHKKGCFLGRNHEEHKKWITGKYNSKRWNKRVT